MDISIPKEQFVKFLCDAKIATYAAQDNESSVKPLLPRSHQLEFRRGSLLYRDIYYGGEFFVGSETVFNLGDPIWAMCYAGGVNEGFDIKNAPNIYDFLQSSLREVPISAPFRGPEKFVAQEFQYINRVLGNVWRFSGVETIQFKDTPIYQLHYSGGRIKE